MLSDIKLSIFYFDIAFPHFFVGYAEPRCQCRCRSKIPRHASPGKICHFHQQFINNQTISSLEEPSSLRSAVYDHRRMNDKIKNITN